MPDTDRLINKAQGDDIITALNGIASRLQEMYTVDDAMSSSSENPVQNKVVTAALDNKVDKVDGKGLSTNDYTNDDKASVASSAEQLESTQTVSGNPITLTDAAPINAESLVVELEPKQDLHGQSAPYVGGAGKNKLPMTVDGIKALNANGTWSGNTYTVGNATFTIETDTDGNVTGIKVNGGNSSNTSFFLTSGNLSAYGGMILNGTPNTVEGAYMCAELQDSPWTSYAADYGSGSEISNDIGAGTWIFIRIYAGSSISNVMFYPMIRLSTETDPTFAPYSNICPITGYTECEVDDVGKNLVDASEIQAGYWDVNDDSIPFVASYSWQALPKMRCSGGENYTFSCKTNNLSGNIAFIDKNGKLISYVGGGSVMSKTVETPANCYLITAYLNIACTEIQLEKGSTATPYEPYHSSNATIQFGQTVYGGRSNFTEGGTDDEWENVDLGDLSWAYWSQYERFEAHLSNVNKSMYTTDDILCSCFKPDYSPIAASGIDGTIAIYNDGTLLVICKEYTDASTFRTAMTGQTVCYKKATPTTISTPPTDLKLLKGTNNLTTNGTTINLGYQPDNVIGEVKGEIEKCSPNPEFMHFEVNGNVVDAIPIIFDEAIHSYTVSGDNWKDKTFLCVECCDMRYGILQLVLSSDMAFVDSCGKGLLLYPYMRSIEQYIKISISLGQSYGYEISYQTTNTSSLLDYLKIRVRLFN